MSFDLATYQRRAGRLCVDDIDFDVFRTSPLREPVLRCVRYAHDVELHTACYLRNLLNTRAHADPDITAFLVLWTFEEYWHGEALASVLEAHGEVAGSERVAALRHGQRRRDAVAPLAWWAFSLPNPHFVTLFMTFGLINEWTTHAGYARMAALSESPMFSELLHRIMRQEGRHVDFYLHESRTRLSASRGAQRTVRALVRSFWSPVGHKLLPKEDSRHHVRTLFGDSEGRRMAERIDRKIDALPGLDGMHLVSRAVDRYS